MHERVSTWRRCRSWICRSLVPAAAVALIPSLSLAAAAPRQQSERSYDARIEFNKGFKAAPAATQLQAAADVKQGIRTLVVPGSYAVKAQAEQEGLDKVFTAAGFDWREPGCSMCLAMNPDKLAPGERCASTSNRNFEGRQGKGGRTHLVSPAVAAATAIAGHFATPNDLEQ